MTPNEKLINAAKIGDLPSFTDAVIQGADIDTSDPVSYTHLDVYKRQILHAVRRISHHKIRNITTKKFNYIRR